ncbi:hypothetical protein J2T59_001146 [Methanosalsum natronophilum]|nr:hypothetical protein [Methanosalsum natronophilum]
MHNREKNCSNKLDKGKFSCKKKATKQKKMDSNELEIYRFISGGFDAK